MEDDIVADAALLMRLHHLTLQCVVGLRTSKAADTREHREGLHPKLTHEARHTLTQDLEGLTPVPYAPVVAFTQPQLLGSPPVHRVGTTLYIGAKGILLPKRLGYKFAEEGFVVSPEALVHFGRVALSPSPVLQTLTDLIIPTPSSDAGMLTKATDVVAEFVLDVA